MLDLWQFQRNEIEAAGLRSGEDVELEAERRVQQNAGRLLETAGAAFEALYESPESALSLVQDAWRRSWMISRRSIDQMAAVRQSLEPALIAIQDVSYSLRDYLGRVEANPARLEEIETRLAAIDKLKRKYGGVGRRDSRCFWKMSRGRSPRSKPPASGWRPAGRAEEACRLQYEQAAAELTAATEGRGCAACEARGSRN